MQHRPILDRWRRSLSWTQPLVKSRGGYDLIDIRDGGRHALRQGSATTLCGISCEFQYQLGVGGDSVIVWGTAQFAQTNVPKEVAHALVDCVKCQHDLTSKRQKRGS